MGDHRSMPRQLVMLPVSQKAWYFSLAMARVYGAPLHMSGPCAMMRLTCFARQSRLNRAECPLRRVTSNVFGELMLKRSPFWGGTEHTFLVGRLAGLFNVPDGKAGILILRVAEGSPAFRIGLRGGWVRATLEQQPVLLGGDIILKIYGVRIGDTDFHTRIRERRRELGSDDTIEISVLRDGEISQPSKAVSSLGLD